MHTISQWIKREVQLALDGKSSHQEIYTPIQTSAIIYQSPQIIATLVTPSPMCLSEWIEWKVVCSMSVTYKTHWSFRSGEKKISIIFEVSYRNTMPDTTEQGFFWLYTGNTTPKFGSARTLSGAAEHCMAKLRMDFCRPMVTKRAMAITVALQTGCIVQE